MIQAKPMQGNLQVNLLFFLYLYKTYCKADRFQHQQLQKINQSRPSTATSKHMTDLVISTYDQDL